MPEVNELFKKLNYKQQPEIVILQAPGSLDIYLRLPYHVRIVRLLEEVEQVDFVMAFVQKRQEVDALAPLLCKKMNGDAVIWFCYPKGRSKKYKCDFNRDTGWSSLYAVDLAPVRMVAIDEDWSALRFRRTRYIKK